MDDYDLVCGQINLGVPYRKIDSIQFKIKGQQKVNNQTVFELEFQCKYEGLNKADKPVKIKRKFTDFQWLATSIKSQYSNFLIIPYLENFEKGYASSFVWSLVSAKIINYSKQRKDADTACKYERIVINRFITILGQISLKYMYQKLGEPKNPLFIFIQKDQDFKFFRSLYDQQNKPQENIFSGYLNAMLDYIPQFLKKKSVETYGLEVIRQKVQKLYNKGNELMQRLKTYRSELEKTYENFIKKKGRQQLRLKISNLETFIYRLEQNLRYVHLILRQISENIQKFMLQMQKSEYQVDKYIPSLVKQYLGFAESERSQINGRIHRIGRQFMEENMKDKERVQIEIGEIYSNYIKSVTD